MKSLVFVIVLVSLLAACAAGPTGAQRADAQAARDAGIPIMVTLIPQSWPNSAGGVDAGVTFTNISGRTLKYVNFDVAAFNGVGDLAPCTIRRRALADLRVTGPIEPDANRRAAWGNVWYNYSIRCTQIESITVTFMNDDTLRLTGDSLALAVPATVIHEGVGASNSCKLR